MIGLIDHFVWIAPNFTQDLDTSDRGALRRTKVVEMGVVEVKRRDERDREVSEQRLCECETPPTRRFLRCSYMEMEESSQSDESEPIMKLIYPDSCKNRRAYNRTVVYAKDAVQELRSGRLLDFVRRDNLILDIDEDFFGIELPWQKLVDAHVSSDVLKQFNSALSDLLCTYNAHDEARSNQVMQHIFKFYVAKCNFSPQKDNADQGFVFCKKDVEDLSDECFTEVVVHYWKQTPRLFCPENDAQFRTDLMSVFDTMTQLPLKQLQVIFDLGFCLQASPKTLDFNESPSVTICHGHNDPAHSFTQVHRPSADELRSSMLTMKQLLDALPPPQLVTIARSSRDGFVPRDLAPRIEQELLGHLWTQRHRLRDERRQFKLSLDEDLMRIHEPVNRSAIDPRSHA